MPPVPIQQAFELAVKHHQTGRLAEAEAIYRQILAVQPRHAGALHLLGVLAHQMRRNDAAVDLIRQAIASAPENSDFHSNLGIALSAQERWEDAIAAYRRALQIQPDNAEAHYNLGVALKAQGRMDEAIAAYHQALRLRPDFTEAHSNLGGALKDAGQLDEAIGAYRRAIQIGPDVAVFHNNLGCLLKDRAQLEEAAESCRRAVALKPDDAALHSSLILTSLYEQRHDDAALGEEIKRWEQRHGAPLAKFVRPHENQADPRRRLKVGYVSQHFQICAPPHFMLPLLEAHDHAGFEIHCYASVKRPDPITERIRKSADVWRDVFGVSDEALAERIREDGIDILVDLAMHTGSNRLLVFARKPAPVQVTWLAYPGTSGLRAMDYRLTDAWMDPEASPCPASLEELVRLPDSWFCYDPLDEVPPPGELPALRAGHVTFGCLNNFCKVNEAVLERWAALLHTVADAKLLLRCPEGESRARVRHFFQAHGIAQERVEFAPAALPRAEYQRLIGRMDIALDPFPYNGGTTTCEALWMGVPVLTLPGEPAVSRQGLSVLMGAGFPEWAAHTEADYVRLAASLAGDLPRLAELRSALRQRMKSSALMDGQRFAKNVEHAYRAMWRKWCATQKPVQTP